MAFIFLMPSLVTVFTAQCEVGCFSTPPSKAGFSKESVIASGQRGGDLVPTDANFMDEYNREMGEAMEVWNAHRWEEAVELFRKIYTRHPDSPWAAEAELHVACYCKYNALYDEAETRFLSVMKKYSADKRIPRKALYYLPHLYAVTGRPRAARDALDVLKDAPMSWQEQQFYENWARIFHEYEQRDENDRLCGAKAAAIALTAIEQNEKGESLRNISLDDVYARYEWARQPAPHSDGYSLSEISRLCGGTPRRLNYRELKSLAMPGSPVVACLGAPKEPSFYQDLNRSKTKEDQRSSGHYLIVENATDRFVDILDPNGGRSRWSAAHFRYRWTGVALLVSQNDCTLGVPVSATEAAQFRGGCCAGSFVLHV
jgi:hypothetical protein